MFALLCFESGSEDGGVQLVGLDVAGLEGDAADRAGLLVFLPTGADEVTARHALHGDGIGLLDQERPTAQVVGASLGRLRKICDVRANHVVGHPIQRLEPEHTDGGQNAAFVRNAVGHHAIKGTAAVGGNHQKRIVAVIHVAHLPAAGGGQSWNCAFEQSVVRVVLHLRVSLSSPSRSRACADYP